MIMSFASPLGVGVTSTGEYFDMELKTAAPSAWLKERLNREMAEGIRILSIRRFRKERLTQPCPWWPAADYLVAFREGKRAAGGMAGPSGRISGTGTDPDLAQDQAE